MVCIRLAHRPARARPAARRCAPRGSSPGEQRPRRRRRAVRAQDHLGPRRQADDRRRRAQRGESSRVDDGAAAGGDHGARHGQRLGDGARSAARKYASPSAAKIGATERAFARSIRASVSTNGVPRRAASRLPTLVFPVPMNPVSTTVAIPIASARLSSFGHRLPRFIPQLRGAVGRFAASRRRALRTRGVRKTSRSSRRLRFDFALEEPAQARHVVEPRHAVDVVGRGVAVDAAEHDGLPVAHQHVRGRLAGDLGRDVVDRAGEVGLARLGEHVEQDEAVRRHLRRDLERDAGLDLLGRGRSPCRPRRRRRC